MKRCDACGLLHEIATFNADSHTYLGPSRRELPGISAILRAGGLIQDWRGNQEAMDRGSRVHLACHYDNLGVLDEASVFPDELGYVTAWRRAKADLGITVLHSEVPVVNEALGYGTQIDSIARLTHPPGWARTVAAINLKTGQEWPHYSAQLAGEALCFGSPVMRLAIYLGDDGRYRPMEYAERGDFDDFRACLRLYYLKERDEWLTLTPLP